MILVFEVSWPKIQWLFVIIWPCSTWSQRFGHTTTSTKSLKFMLLLLTWTKTYQWKGYGIGVKNHFWLGHLKKKIQYYISFLLIDLGGKIRLWEKKVDSGKFDILFFLTNYIRGRSLDQYNSWCERTKFGLSRVV